MRKVNMEQEKPLASFDGEQARDIMTSLVMSHHLLSILEDKWLVARARTLTVSGSTAPLGYAIPVGGKRRAGYLDLPLSEEAAEYLIRTLSAKEKEGFPNLRFRGCHVEWGEPFAVNVARETKYMIIERGRLFGYREDAIRDMVKASRRTNGIDKYFRKVLQKFQEECLVAA